MVGYHPRLPNLTIQLTEGAFLVNSSFGSMPKDRVTHQTSSFDAIGSEAEG
jgi:hypothetical protein